MVVGIEHVAIASPDVHKLAQWYVETLGFTINFDPGTVVFAKAPNGSMIEFIPAEGNRPAQTMKTPGLRHLALTVTDFEAVLAKLKAAGVKFVTEPSDKNGLKIVFFEDPEGNYLHLVQRQTPLP